MSLQNTIQGEIAAHATGARFGLNSIPRHTHNNVDSPYTFQPILNYVGIVESNAVVALFPKGWKLTKTATGQYTITHNLGLSALYTIMVTIHDEGNSASAGVQTPITNRNAFVVDTYNSLGAVNNGFHFLVTVINNRSQTLPIYIGTLT